MPDIWVMAGHILIPLLFGLIPGLLPMRVPLRTRWLLWLALIGGGGAFVIWLQEGADPFHWLGIATLALSGSLSLCVLLAESRRMRSPQA